ncbi:MAG: AMP-binding protein [Acidobacteria bacterium]|nr:AMP-binding protein [Acidobacteriota bacterium]
MPPLGNALPSAAERCPDKTALVVEERTWSFQAIDEATTRLARTLLVNHQPGDRVALHFTNGYELAVAYYACFKAGLVAVPLNTRMKGPELAYVLNHSGARVYLGQSSLYGEIHQTRPSIALDDFFISGDRRPFSDVADLEPLMNGGGATELASTEVTLPRVTDDMPAVIMYTSGTTARPKGVTHTHRTLGCLARAGLDVAEANGREDDVSGIVLPACHIFGLSVLVSTWMAGNTVVMIPRFDPPFVLEQLQRHRVTIFGALPVMLNALLHVPNASSFDISGLRACFAGGDAVATELQRRFKETFRVDVTEACGMTEVQPYACNPLGARGKVGSIGLPAPGATLRLVDEFGRDVADGEAGEVLVKSPAAMVGYWKDPDATAATIRDGWLSTGDLARKDADGYYWFVGRKKEIIVRGGSNISPLEVEDAIYQYPAVREVGVVGCPSSDLGEVVLAFVGLKNGDSATEQDIKDFLAARMAAYKIPERIIFVPELPKGLTGKVHRRTLKEWAAQG